MLFRAVIADRLSVTDGRKFTLRDDIAQASFKKYRLII
jgi:hypothetical protein